MLRRRSAILWNALGRFDPDVLAQPGVKWLMALEGINDIGFGSRPDTPASDAVASDDLIAALKQLIERAYAHGIKVVGGTLTPYEGAAYYTEAVELQRRRSLASKRCRVIRRWRTDRSVDFWLKQASTAAK